MNDGIELELCSLKYTSVSEAVRRVMAMDPGTHLTKIDIESAYRIMPVHPDDRSLLGMEWKGRKYIDLALPFGLRSAPKIFNTLADALQWILQSEGIESIHYLDDFLIFGPPDKEVCEKQLKEVEVVFRRLGVPIACHKTEGPARVITFLGIMIDLVAGILRLPEEKVARLSQTIREWGDRRSCTKRELLSLIGQLQHACCVVRPGRTFLRRMITLSTSAKEMHHHIRLNRGFRSDLQWWACFLPEWNGTSLMSSVHGEGQGGCNDYIRCIWGILIIRQVVSAAIATVMGGSAHNSERASPRSVGASIMEEQVAREDNTVPVRQRGSGGRPELGEKQG